MYLLPQYVMESTGEAHTNWEIGRLSNTQPIIAAVASIISRYEEEKSAQDVDHAGFLAMCRLQEGLTSLLMHLKMHNPDMSTSQIATHIFEELPDSLERQDVRDVHRIRENVMGKAIDQLIETKEADPATRIASDVSEQIESTVDEKAL